MSQSLGLLCRERMLHEADASLPPFLNRAGPPSLPGGACWRGGRRRATGLKTEEVQRFNSPPGTKGARVLGREQ
ncbi:hypothetical protein CCH79_00003353, partial [Gambusia affinis]